MREKSLYMESLISCSMLGDNGGNIHTRIGIMASSIKAPQYIRYCPECHKEDINRFGEPYWHRVHQVPGSGYLICAKHMVMLQNSEIATKSINKHEYYTSSKENSKVQEKKYENHSSEIQKLLKIAREIEWISNSKLESKSTHWFCEQYKTLLIEKGFATANGRVFQEELVNSFVELYGEDYLEKLQLAVKVNSTNWLASIVRKHRKTFHPIRHILFIDYIS